MSTPVICPPSHSHGAAQTCYNKHRCRCDSCMAKSVEARVKHKATYRRRAGSGRFEDAPVTPIPQCTPEDAVRVRRSIARHATTPAECAEFEAMLGVSA